MSDFVSNLIARATGTADTIRPRLPSVFEPTEASQAARFAPSLESTEKRESTADPNEMPPEKPRLQRNPVQTPRETSAKDDAGFLGASSRRMPQSKKSLETPTQPHLPHSDLREPVAQEKTRAPLAPSIAPQPQLNVAEPPLRVLTPTIPEKPSKQPVPGKLDLPAVAAPASGVKRQFHSETAGPEVLRVRESPKASLEAKAIPVLARPVLQPLNAKERAMRRPQQESVVHVTIGRIEVRAVPQEPKTKQERRSSAVMSLDEYLRTRTKVVGR